MSVCENLRTGISFTRSCKVSGISKQTGFAWRSSGWQAIEDADPDSTEAISFVAKFALETELALADFQRPLIQRIRDGASGKSKGDWRAAQQLLASRFPDEWSDRTHVAKSGRVEISAAIAVEHQHGYREFLHMRNMSAEELQFEIERLSSQVDNATISGAELDAEITFLQARVSAMVKASADGRSFSKGNWLALNPAIRPTAHEVIDLDAYEIKDNLAATDSSAVVPIEEGVGAPVHGFAPAYAEGAVEPPAMAAPLAPPTSRSIAFDANSGLAFNVPADDEDLSL